MPYPCSDPFLTRLSAHVVVATVRGDEHGDSRPAIGFDFVVVLCSRLIEACDHQEIGSFEKRGKQAGGPERIGHVQKRLRVRPHGRWRKPWGAASSSAMASPTRCVMFRDLPKAGARP